MAEEIKIVPIEETPSRGWRGRITAPKTALVGFVDFIRERGVMGLAIGFVLGTSVQKVVTAMVDDLILETNKKFGLTSIVISHDILSALYSADNIGFLFGGKIVFWGTPEEFQKCDHPMARSFLDAEKRHKSVVGQKS